MASPMGRGTVSRFGAPVPSHCAKWLSMEILLKKPSRKKSKRRQDDFWGRSYLLLRSLTQLKLFRRGLDVYGESSPTGVSARTMQIQVTLHPDRMSRDKVERMLLETLKHSLLGFPKFIIKGARQLDLAQATVNLVKTSRDSSLKCWLGWMSTLTDDIEAASRLRDNNQVMRLWYVQNEALYAVHQGPESKSWGREDASFQSTVQSLNVWPRLASYLSISQP